MSISLIIYKPKNESQRMISVPVATERFFSDYWKPNALGLGLELVPQFSSGIVVGEEELNDIRRELSILRSWAVGQNETPESVHVIDRIDRVMAALPDLVSSYTKVYIG